MDNKAIRWEGVYWIHEAQNTDQQQALENAGMANIYQTTGSHIFVWNSVLPK
jgi:hypothetical protein